MGILKPGINDAATTDPERSKMFVDPEVAKTVTRSSEKVATFRCLDSSSHPTWDAPVQRVIAKECGCPTCAGRLVVLGVNDAATTDPERSKMFADPEVAKSVTRRSAKKAWFRCLDDPRHPDWEASVFNVMKRTGCPTCVGRVVVVGLNDAATTDSERSKMFADPEVAKTVTRSSKSKQLFQCLGDARHHPWEATVANVVANGQGCPTCAGVRCVAGINDAATTDPERSAMFADPEVASAVTRSSHKRVLFRCQTHGEWESKVYHVMVEQHGCPSCSVLGFNPSLPATLYILDATTHIVFGITGNLDRRLKDYDGSRVLLHRFDYDDGGEARRIESAIKRQFKHCRYDESTLHGERSESLTLDCLVDLLAFVAQTSGNATTSSP